MELLYGVVNKRGQLVMASDDEDEALAIAKRQARGKQVIQMTSDTEDDPPRPNPNPSGMARKAFVKTGLPVVDIRDVLAMSVEEAYWGEVNGRSIQSFMPKHTQRSDYYPGRPDRSASYFAGGMLTANAKLSKDTQKEVYRTYGIRLRKVIETWGLNLSPAQRAWEYVNSPVRVRGALPTVCAGASKECIAGCLVGTGSNRQGGLDWEGRKFGKGLRIDELYQFGIKVKYTQALYHNPVGFLRLVVDAIERKVRARSRQGIAVYIRLNVLSDVPWEELCPGLFQHFRRVQFYDYTKVAGRITPPNYNLTFSFSGSNIPLCVSELESGTNVAVVFLNPKGMRKKPVPLRRFWDRPVLSGDKYDARPIDHRVLHRVDPDADTAVISLYYKLPGSVTGSIRASELGSFVVDVYRDPETGLFLAAETPNQTPGTDGRFWSVRE